MTVETVLSELKLINCSLFVVQWPETLLCRLEILRFHRKLTPESYLLSARCVMRSQMSAQSVQAPSPDPNPPHRLRNLDSRTLALDLDPYGPSFSLSTKSCPHCWTPSAPPHPVLPLLAVCGVSNAIDSSSRRSCKAGCYWWEHDIIHRPIAFNPVSCRATVAERTYPAWLCNINPMQYR